MRQPILLIALLVISLAATASAADSFIQLNAAREAHAVINNTGPSPNTGSSMDHNEYPVFTNDGKLFFWTRQENPTPGTQWLWVSYFKNRSAFDSTTPGSTLPALQMSTPKEIHLVNHQFASHGGTPIAGVPSGAEIKAFSTCEESQQPTDAGSQWRYRVTLYMAVGTPTGLKQMWRQHRLVIYVNKATGAIGTITTAPATHTPTQVIPTATAHGGGTANETEPFVTRDGKYLFWGSNKWGGNGNMAEYIYSSTACGMTNQTPQPYSSLPMSNFGWEDQYTPPQSQAQRTSRTNYHTSIELNNGRKALIFEECRGQTPNQGRDSDCAGQDERLSSTGFFAGNSPTPIANRSGLSGGALLWQSGGRTTHPWISGPRNPDGSWLLFFMRGKKIWYTKIGYVP